MSIHTNPYRTVEQDRALDRQRQDREDRDAEAARAQRQRNEENAKIRAERLQGIEDRREAEREERLAADDADFVDARRRGYMASDPTATEESFQHDLPEIRRSHRIAAAVNGPNEDELAVARADAARYF